MVTELFFDETKVKKKRLKLKRQAEKSNEKLTEKKQ